MRPLSDGNGNAAMSRSKSKEPTAPAPVDPIEEIEAQIKDKRTSLATMRSSTCFPLFLRSASIGHSLVDDILDDLSPNSGHCKEIHVLSIQAAGALMPHTI